MSNHAFRPRKSRAIVAASAVAFTGALVLPSTAHATTGGENPPAAKSVETIASGLMTPWGIDTGPDGSVFVAENSTGNIVKIWNGEQGTMATTQPGLDDVAFDAGWAVSYVIGAPPEDAEEADDAAGDLIGRAFLDGTLAATTPIGAAEDDDAADDAPDAPEVTYGIDATKLAPDCEVPDEVSDYTDDVELEGDGYGLLALDDGRRYVADEANGQILSIGQDGAVSVVSALQPVAKTLPAQLDTADGPIPVPACLVGAAYTAQPMPTSVAEGPDGWLYVGGQVGSEDINASGVVFRVNPWTGESSVWQDGLTAVSDIAFDPQGRLYVAEASGEGVAEEDDAEPATGALKRIDTTWVGGGLVPAGVTTIAVGSEVTPRGVATDDSGAVYVAVDGMSDEDTEPTADGAVLKLTGF